MQTLEYGSSRAFPQRMTERNAFSWRNREFPSREVSDYDRAVNENLYDLLRRAVQPVLWNEISSPRFDFQPTFTLDHKDDFSIEDAVRQMTIGAAESLSVQMRERIRAISALKPNWDGDGAKPVKPFVLADTIETLKRLSDQTANFIQPFVFPTFDGFIQLEWHEQKRSLDIEAIETGWSAVGTTLDTSERQYLIVEFERNNFQQVSLLYQWVVGSVLLWPSL